MLNGRSLKVEFINVDINYTALIEQLTKDVLNSNINLSKSKDEINILREDLEKIEKDIDK